jgi:hypothetical protein
MEYLRRVDLSHLTTAHTIVALICEIELFRFLVDNESVICIREHVLATACARCSGQVGRMLFRIGVLAADQCLVHSL